MRRFSSYGPVDTEEHYYAPRQELIEKAYKQLMGDNPQKTGYYITVWAPRQTGKTWLMQQILLKLEQDPRFHTIALSLEDLKDESSMGKIINTIAKEIGERSGRDFSQVNNRARFKEIFR